MSLVVLLVGNHRNISKLKRFGWIAEAIFWRILSGSLHQDPLHTHDPASGRAAPGDCTRDTALFRGSWCESSGDLTMLDLMRFRSQPDRNAMI